MEDRSDGQRLTAWNQRDTDAFEGLVDSHQAALLRHARAMLGSSIGAAGGARSGAEDVVQETFLRLAQKPPEIPASAAGDPEAERAVLSSWLHRVTRNLCMDALRSETRRKRREQMAAPEEAVPGGLDRVEADDTRQAVEKSLERLPDDQREVLVLRLFGDQSYKEIAAITGKKIGTIGWLISVGLKALASELAPLVPIPATASEGDSRSIEAQRLQGGLS